jgi:hypothetical protein
VSRDFSAATAQGGQHDSSVSRGVQCSPLDQSRLGRVTQQRTKCVRICKGCMPWPAHASQYCEAAHHHHPAHRAHGEGSIRRHSWVRAFPRDTGWHVLSRQRGFHASPGEETY